MRYRGLLSFALGGTLLMFVYWYLNSHPDVSLFDPTLPLVLTVAVFSFAGVLLVGIGLWLIMRDART